MSGATTDALTFPFGQTPEPIIRERLADWQRRADGDYLHFLIWRDTDADSLIDVLDSLKHTALDNVAKRSDGLGETVGDRCRRHRIEALAELRITEG